jgi:3-isopropylmalate/(R)-2-methylmalate dehydratase small subunit
MRRRAIEGRVWVLIDGSGRLIEDIDTDQIFHNAHLHITDISQMGPYALGNLEGWKDFPKKAGPGDIVVAGRNFGAGSSRQQAVDCFIALGVAAVLAPSFAAIYFRNAVNSGYPVLRGRNLGALVAAGTLASGVRIGLDLETGEGTVLASGTELGLEPMSGVQRDIFRAGDLFAFGQARSRSR